MGGFVYFIPADRKETLAIRKIRKIIRIYTCKLEHNLEIHLNLYLKLAILSNSEIRRWLDLPVLAARRTICDFIYEPVYVDCVKL